MRKSLLILLIVAFVMAGCRNQKSASVSKTRVEDTAAKKMLQGIWINEDEENVFFRVQGDTIYYPDSVSQPAYFRILSDTLYIEGANTAKYPIRKQAAHIFQFSNTGGDLIKLVKSENPEADMAMFQKSHLPSVNQNQLIKRDSVVMYGNDKYHWYVQVNPTTYKVYNSSFNEDGVEVDHVFYDNIVHVSLFNGKRQIFSHDFHKNDFASKVPSSFLKTSVLSDIRYTGANTSGFHFMATIQKPESASSFLVDIIVSFSGRMTLKVQ